MSSNNILVVTLCFIILLTGNPAAKTLEPIDSLPLSENNKGYKAIELGKRLFFDRRLSGDGTMSCATCHIPDMAFTDGMEISLSYPTTKNWRNTPTVINSVLHRYFFWDGRAKTLEEQAPFPIMSSFEMNLNLDYLEEKIRQVPEYNRDFKDALNEEVSLKGIAKALAAFQKSLISRNAPLDRYLKGDTNALSEDAKKGMELFVGKAGCIKCHYGKALMDNKFHHLGVPERPEHIEDPQIAITRRFVAKIHGYKDYKLLKEDLGRYLITKDKKDWKAFKTPSLREVSKTAPYMHNGYYQSLEEVIDFFNRGGGEGNKALRPLNLTTTEKAYLKTFLIEALTGEELKITHPEIP